MAEVIADLLREGIQVCLPVSEHLPFDLVAISPSLTDLRRIQVKYAAANRKGAINLGLRRTHADRHGVHTRPIRLEEIDALAIYCPETDAVYYVRRDEISIDLRSCFVLRLLPAKNGQVAKTRPAKDFAGPTRIFGPVAQWIEPPASNRLGGGSIPSGPARMIQRSLS